MIWLSRNGVKLTGLQAGYGTEFRPADLELILISQYPNIAQASNFNSRGISTIGLLQTRCQSTHRYTNSSIISQGNKFRANPNRHPFSVASWSSYPRVAWTLPPISFVLLSIRILAPNKLFKTTFLNPTPILLVANKKQESVQATLCTNPHI